MLIPLIVSASALNVVAGSLLQIESAYTESALFVNPQYDVGCARSPRDEGRTWTLEPVGGAVQRRAIACNESVLLLSADYESYAAARTDGSVALSGSGDERGREWTLLCRGAQQHIDADSEFILRNGDYDCYLTAARDGGDCAVRCAALSSAAVMRISRGVFLDEDAPAAERSGSSDEL